MSGRLEYKYLVPNSLADAIRSDLRPFMRIDPFADKRPAGQYTVRSVYYDSPHFACYEEKYDGLEMRRKYRIRGYDLPKDDSIVFLEIKRKHGDVIAKSRAPVLYRDLEALLSSRDVTKYVVQDGARRGEEDAERFFYHYFRHALRPAVLVVYDREAFSGKYDPSLRLTFDKNLRGAVFPALADLYDEQCLEYALAEHFIFELKFFRRSLPLWVRRLIRHYELRRMALSKYTICLDARGAPRMSLQMRTRSVSRAG